MQRSWCAWSILQWYQLPIWGITTEGPLRLRRTFAAAWQRTERVPHRRRRSSDNCTTKFQFRALHRRGIHFDPPKSRYICPKKWEIFMVLHCQHAKPWMPSQPVVFVQSHKLSPPAKVLHRHQRFAFAADSRNCEALEWKLTFPARFLESLSTAVKLLYQFNEVQ